MSEAYKNVLSKSSETLSEAISSPIVQSVVQSKVVQRVVKSEEMQVLVNSTPVRHTINNIVSIIGDKRLWYFIGGATIGFYFGFRMGVVSVRASQYLESIQWMRAAAIYSYGGIKSIQISRVRVPKLTRDSEILIEVKAASLDPVDIKVSLGWGRGMRELVNRYNPNATDNFPVILGRDGTGVVKEVGDEVTDLKVGDRVWFIVPYCLQGSISSYAVLDREYVRRMPSCLSYEGGATLPYTGSVAWDILVTSGGLEPNQIKQDKSVFIWGGVRPVERLCLQLAKAWGCSVTCIGPIYTHQYLRSMGASNVLSDDFSEVKKHIRQGSRYDVVVNTAGLTTEELCLALCKPDGRIVTTLVQAPGLSEYGVYTNILASLLSTVSSIFTSNLFGTHRKWIQTNMSGDILDNMAALVEDRKIDPIGEKIYTLDQVELAVRSIASGGHKGKIVIRLDDMESSWTSQDRLALI